MKTPGLSQALLGSLSQALFRVGTQQQNFKTNLTELNSASAVSWGPLVALKLGTRPSTQPSNDPPAAKL